MARGEIRHRATLQFRRAGYGLCRVVVVLAVLGTVTFNVTGCARQEPAQASDTGGYALEAPVVTVRTLPLRVSKSAELAKVNDKPAPATEARPRRRRRSRPRPQPDTPPAVRPTVAPVSTMSPSADLEAPIASEKPGVDASSKKPDAPAAPPEHVIEPKAPNRDPAPTPAPEPKAPVPDGNTDG